MFENLGMRNCFITLLFVVNTIFLFGQNLLPPIYNYNLSEHKGVSKNWGMALNKNEINSKSIFSEF